jgi:hypothetical protein
MIFFILNGERLELEDYIGNNKNKLKWGISAEKNKDFWSNIKIENSGEIWQQKKVADRKLNSILHLIWLIKILAIWINEQK